MSCSTPELQRLGFSDWFERRADQERTAIHDIARVVSVQRDSFMVTRGDKDVFAELSGNLLYSTESSADLPTTGDWIYVDFFDDDTHAVVYGVLPRKSLLTRKTAGRTVDYQLIAANIDVAFIIQSLNENLSLRRLERYLSMVYDAGIEPVILLSKCDLLPGHDVLDIEASVHNIAPAVTLKSFSNLDENNVAEIAALLVPRQTYCLLGSSGVGKTTLLNSMTGTDRFETRSVSRIQSKGRHTTTSRQLVRLNGGAMIIDTPGMRELGGISLDRGLDETFAEIEELTRSCRFSDCTHSGETGCAIAAAMESGGLSSERFQNYLKLKRETDFNQMSYRERRQKERTFGKMVKSVIKSKKR